MPDLQRDLTRGRHALDLMEDTLLNECFQAVEAAYMEAWRSSPAGAAVDRERCWMALRLIEQIRGHLMTVMQDGQIAAAEIAQEQDE